MSSQPPPQKYGYYNNGTDADWSSKTPRPRWWTCHDNGHPNQVLFTRTTCDHEGVIIFDPDSYYVNQLGYGWGMSAEEAKLQYTLLGSCDDAMDRSVEWQFLQFTKQQEDQ